MQRLIFSLFIVTFKAKCTVKNPFIIVYLILTNKLLLNTKQNKKIFFL